MEFNENKPIYLQIFDVICDRILSGDLQPDARIPSVREYGAAIGVNPNTVMRTYEKLTADGIIFNRRGIGYFVAPDAIGVIREAQRKQFLGEELPAILRKMQLLDIDPSVLLSHRAELPESAAGMDSPRQD